ncbi:MAG: hypothetical protein ACTSYB_17260 [Candidatus Helarchaeota archaeon]
MRARWITVSTKIAGITIAKIRIELGLTEIISVRAAVALALSKDVVRRIFSFYISNFWI